MLRGAYFHEGHDHDHADDFFHDGDAGSGEDGDDSFDVTWALDNVELTTVGVDVGSSTSHLLFAKLHLQRLTQSLSSRFVVVHREEAARQGLGEALEVQLGEQQVRRGRTDVDTNRRQLDVVERPGDVKAIVAVLTRASVAIVEEVVRVVVIVALVEICAPQHWLTADRSLRSLLGECRRQKRKDWLSPTEPRDIAPLGRFATLAPSGVWEADETEGSLSPIGVCHVAEPVTDDSQSPGTDPSSAPCRTWPIRRHTCRGCAGPG